MTRPAAASFGPRGSRTFWIVALLAAELAGLALAYQVLTRFECEATGAAGACVTLRGLVARGFTVLAAFAVYVRARPAGISRLIGTDRSGPGRQLWPMLHVAGLLLMLAPLVVAGGEGLGQGFLLALGPWTIGGAAAALGALFWLAPPAAWADWLRAERGLPLAVVAGAASIPDLGARALPLWDLSLPTQATFLAVAGTLRQFGAEPVVVAQDHLIGVDGFLVHIAAYCSGVEGFVLVTGFTLLYALLFRTELRFPLYWILVLPTALGLSWLLNVVRLAALIAIGAHVSPELAIGGFHSYAGWLFFTLLALGLLLAVQSLPFLWSSPADGQAPERPRDRPRGLPEAGALILPFVAFMLASVATAALSPVPDLAYPVKVVATSAILLRFAGSYRAIDWRPDPVAAAAGAAIGLFWLATRAAPTAGDDALAGALAGLAPALVAVWILLRLAGTVLLVPLVEELFFRGYLMARLDGGTVSRRLLAIAVSSALFALLHGRWLAAGLAGLVFALVMLRRGRLGDAILAHAIANLIVAAWALLRGDWSAI